MTRISPWSSQHKWASLSEQDLPFHLKTAVLPKLTETMSLASPHLPNSNSSSRCQPTHDRHPHERFKVRGSRHLPLSTPWLHQGCDSPPHPGELRPAPLSSMWPRKLGLAHTHTNKHTKNRKGPTHAVWYDPFLTQSPAAKREEKTLSLGGHHGTTIPQTELFSPTVTSPTCS